MPLFFFQRPCGAGQVYTGAKRAGGFTTALPRIGFGKPGASAHPQRSVAAAVQLQLDSLDVCIL